MRDLDEVEGPSVMVENKYHTKFNQFESFIIIRIKMGDLAEVEGPRVVIEDESKRGKLGVTNNLIL